MKLARWLLALAAVAWLVPNNGSGRLYEVAFAACDLIAADDAWERCEG